jgi:uncharacterized protein (DUF952 family)
MIYHITSRAAWSAAEKSGAYTTDSLKNEGFIHCSKIDQVLRVANTWYTAQHGLILLKIDPTRLTPEMRWEAGSDKPDELFPHLYGAINLDAVVEIIDFEPDNNGIFILPSSLTL